MDAATAQLPASEAVQADPPGDVLRQADGIELIGEFEGSGFKDPPLLARRADGQVVQLTKLLYEVAAASDGHRDTRAVADLVGSRCGLMVNASDVAFLAERKLRPLGVLALPDGTTPVLTKRPPVMALRHRKPLLSERAVNATACVFTWLHLPFVQSALPLGVAASVIVATAFHEFGRYEVTPGRRQAGIRRRPGR